MTTETLTVDYLSEADLDYINATAQERIAERAKTALLVPVFAEEKALTERLAHIDEAITALKTQRDGIADLLTVFKK